MVAADAQTILVADDECLVLDMICDTLASRKYRVLRANNGEEALALAADLSQRIDLLITDIAMDNVDGLELADRLVAERPAMGVLYMSGYCDDKALGRRVAGKRTGFLHKPFTTSQLLSKLERTLGV